MEPFASNDSSLIDLEDDYILDNIDAVYPLLLEYFTESREDSGVIRALEISFGPCLNSFSLDESDEKILQHACPIARKVFIQTLSKLEDYSDDSKTSISGNFCNCEQIASMLAIAIESYATKVSKIEIMKVSHLLTCSSEILYEFYSHCSKSQESTVSYSDSFSQNLRTIFRKAQDLQHSLLQLMSKIEITSGQSAIDVLNEILTFVYKSGMALMNLDVKTMADLWKGYICTLEKYSEHLKNYHEISVPVECLSNNITKQLEIFMHGDSSSSQCIDKAIKILCFILKVIIKITEKFSGCLKNCLNPLMNLLINLNRFGHPQLEAHNMQHTIMEHMKQLVTGVDPLLNCLISDKDFAQEFSLFLEKVALNESKKYPLLLLSSLILKKLTFSSQEIRTVWFSSNENILRWIFQILSKCNFELYLDVRFPCQPVPGKARKTTDCYGHLLMEISSFLMTSTAREFSLAETVLTKYILDPNPWCSLLACDIWCILARFADSELCYEQLNGLIRIFSHFGAGSEMPQKYLLESLIRRLFPLLCEKHRDLLVEHHPKKMNLHLWNVLQIPGSWENVKHLHSSVNKFLSGRSFNERDFEEMESAFNEFEPDTTNVDNEFERKLSNLWKFDSIKLMSNPLSKRYLKFLCTLTKSVIPFVSPTCIYQVLREMKSSLQHFSPVIKLYCLEIVHRCSKEEEALNGESIFQLISSLFYQFLTNQNVFVRTISIDLFSNFAYSTCRTEMITQSIKNDASLKIRFKNYLQRKHSEANQEFNIENCLVKLRSLKWEHICSEDHLKVELNCREPPYKKIILDEIEENPGLEIAISALRREATKIRELSQLRDLSVAEKMKISSVADLLRDIVGATSS